MHVVVLLNYSFNYKEGGGKEEILRKSLLILLFNLICSSLSDSLDCLDQKLA